MTTEVKISINVSSRPGTDFQTDYEKACYNLGAAVKCLSNISGDTPEISDVSDTLGFLTHAVMGGFLNKRPRVAEAMARDYKDNKAIEITIGPDRPEEKLQKDWDPYIKF